MFTVQRTALAGLVAIALFSTAPPLHAQDDATEAPEALDGFDPVKLVDDGAYVDGDLEIAAVHQGYRYVFADRDSRAAFLRAPERYEIQLEGSCARMGLTVGGRPDLFTVHQERIYVFGSNACLSAFEAEPARYLETPLPPLTDQPAARRRGAELIDRALDALGGAERLAAVDGYHQTLTAATGGQAVAATYTMLGSDRFRADRTFPSFGVVTTVVAPEEAFQASPRGRAAMRPGARRQRCDELARHDALTLLRRRDSEGFAAAYTGDGEVDGVAVARVTVALDGAQTTLGIEPESGRVLALWFRGRDNDGTVGEVTRRFADFRTVDGLRVPFSRVDVFADGSEPLSTVTVEQVSVDLAAARAAFEAPAGSAAAEEAPPTDTGDTAAADAG